MRDLTADDMPTFGELTDEERGALMVAWWKGQEIQFFQKDKQVWHEVDRPSWQKRHRYRIKSEPRKPREWWIHPGTNAVCAIKLDLPGFVLVREVIKND